jgi:glyceraldehyde 3-phosphate dehydrogenase
MSEASQATIRVAINGYGRIGRNILRALFERSVQNDIQIVAINDMGDVNTNAYLTKHDSTHGKFFGEVSVSANTLIVNGHEIQVFSERNPALLPWGKLGIDIVFECTGLFTSKEKAGEHLKAGAKKVIISAPGGSDVDATVVYGVNHHILKSEHKVISNASCTTNCLAPIAKVLNDAIGIEQGLMTTIHSYTNDQVLVDTFHKDLYRARSATQSMIPTKTGAAQAIGLILPELNGKLDGFAMRVPTCNVSVVDFVFTAKKSVTVNQINEIIKKASESSELKGILEYNSEPLVSIDFNHNPASSIYDEHQTKVIGNLVKVLSWYDNEWGFSNRMLDVAKAWMKAK